MRNVLKLVVVGLLLIIALPAAAQSGNTVPAITTDITNFRSAPALNATVLAVIDNNQTIELNGRLADNSWLRGNYNGQQGWLFASLLVVQGDVSSLDVIQLAGSSEITVPTETTTGDMDSDSATNGTANFREGPSTAYRIIATLPANTPVVPSGRIADSTWLEVTAVGQVGWIYRPLINTNVDIAALEVKTPPELTADTISVPTTSGAVATPSGIVSGIGARSREIFRTGQALGNRPDVFVKIGDSISMNPNFLYPLGTGGAILDGYAYLQPTLNYFLQTPARTNNSFANESVAVRGGWTSGDVLSPANSILGICSPSETPLVCEYRVNKPAVALIMLGTNDVILGVDVGTFQYNMQQIINTSVEMGVIPVISTIPDNQIGQGERVLQFNAVIRSLAAANAIPLWDYWSALQGVPGNGISSDGYHPSFDPGTQQTGVFTPQYMQYGYNVRNYTALVVLDALRQQVLTR